MTNNKRLIKTIRDKLKQADNEGILMHDKLTDFKLLDLIFWSKANKNEKKAGIKQRISPIAGKVVNSCIVPIIKFNASCQGIVTKIAIHFRKPLHAMPS